MKKQLRKITALALTVIVLFSMLPLDAFAALITTDFSEGMSLRSLIPAVPTHTYQFYVGGTHVSTQIVKNGETLLEPVVPSDPSGNGFEFLGWFDAAAGGSKISFGPITVETTQSINVYAQFGDTYKVSFVYVNTHGNTIVLGAKAVLPGQTVTADGISYAGELEALKAFSHWSATNGGSAYDFNTPVNSSMTLYLVTKDVYKVSFDTQGGTAILPLFVAHGQSITGAGLNPVTTNAGYNFAGWLLNNNAYSLDTPVVSNIELKATWTARTDTPYRVIYWFENAENTNYSIAAYYDTTGTTGAVASFNKPGSGMSYGADFTNFTYNAALSETNKIIDGDGTTLVNVYYQRKTYTLTFRNYYGTFISSHTVKVGASTKPYWDANAAYLFPASGGYLWRDLYDNTAQIEAPLMPARNLTLRVYYYGSSASIQFIEQDANENVIGTIKTVPGIDGVFYGGRQQVGFTWKRVYGRYPNSNSPLQYRYSTSEGVYSDNKVFRTYYQRNVYQLSFNTNGGAPVESLSLPYQEPLLGLAPASYVVGSTTKEVDDQTYLFQGWYDNEALAGDPFTFTGTKMMPANNLTLYAKWVPETINIIWYPSWEGGTPSTGTLIHGQSLLEAGLVPLADPLPPGMTQDDAVWYRKVNDQYMLFPLDTPVHEAGIVLYPRFPNTGYTVTYNSDGGGEAPLDSNIYAINSHAIVKDAPTPPADKVFLGWQNSKDQRIYYPGDAMLVNDNLTLTAQWGNVDIPSSLIYKPNTGSGEDITYNFLNNASHTIIAKPESYAKPGHQFIGWNTYANGSGIWFKPGQTVLVDGGENILYAQWEPFISVTATKLWNLPDPDIAKPNVWFSLYRIAADASQTKVGETQQVPGSNTVTWDGMLKTDGNGYTYVYVVKETDANGADYTPPSFSKAENGLTVTNTYTYIDFKATKVWAGEHLPATKPMIGLQLQVSTNGGAWENLGNEVYLSTDTTSYLWPNLPAANSAGQALTYRAIESTVPKSFAVSYEHGAAGSTITNTYLSTSHTVEKIWSEGNEPKPANWPAIEVQLYRDDLPYLQPVQVPAQTENTFSHTWVGLPQYRSNGTEYDYTAREMTPLTGYRVVHATANGTTTITNTLQSDAITGVKRWDGTPGTSVSFQLYQKVAGSGSGSTYGDPVTITAADNWQHTWTGLPASGPGGNYEYYIEETAVPAGYYYDATQSSELLITNVSQTTSFTATKIGAGGINNRPSSITFYLEQCAVNCTNDANWEKVTGSEHVLTFPNLETTWTGLDRFHTWHATDASQRVEYQYRVREEPVPNYLTTYPDNNTVHNQYKVPTRTVTVTKVWSGGPSADHLAPTITLWRRYIDDSVDPVDPSAYLTISPDPNDGPADSFIYTYTDLPDTDPDGNKYLYGFTEEAADVPEGYTMTIAEPYLLGGKYYALPGGTITNTFDVPMNVDLCATKNWVGGPDADHKRVKLSIWRTIDTVPAEDGVYNDINMEEGVWFLADSTPADGISDTFVGCWRNLAATDNEGNPYTYFYYEDVVPTNYIRTYSTFITVNGVQYARNGATVTNTYQSPADVTATATKTWVDGNPDQYEVDLTLWRQIEGGAMEEVTGVSPAVSGTAPTFSYTWSGLLRTDGNGNPYSYFFTEEQPTANYLVTYDQAKIVAGKQYAYSGATAINTYKPPTADVTAIKNWTNGPEADHIAVPLTLYRQLEGSSTPEQFTAGYTVSPLGITANQFTYTWPDLDQTDSSGTPYTYYFAEEPVAGYTRTYATPHASNENLGLAGTSVTNTYVQPEGSVPGYKVWLMGNQNKRPDVYMKLYRSTASSGAGMEAVPGINTIPINSSTPYTTDPVPGMPPAPNMYTSAFSWDDIHLNSLAGEPYYFFVKEVDSEGNDYTPPNYQKVEEGPYVVNTYQAFGSYTPQLTKTLAGRELKAGEFTFELYNVPNEGEEELLETVTNAADGSVTFSPLVFGARGVGKTRVFYIREKAPATPETGMDYDNTNLKLSIAISDNGQNDGTLILTPEYTPDDTEFNNSYTASGELPGGVWATKALAGRDLQAGEFSFELKRKGAEGVLQTKQNDAAGNISFDAIPYTQADIGKTYTYTITEVVPNPGESGMDYDPMKLTFSVYVEDAGNGALTVTPSFPTDTEFNNTFTPNPAMTVEKTAASPTFTTLGEVISYTLVVTNTGNVPLGNVTVADSLVTLSDTMRTESKTPANGILEVGETWTYTYTYTVTQDDMDAGTVTNSATATDSVQNISAEDEVSVNKIAFTVVKTAAEDRFYHALDTLQYTVVITNTGKAAVPGLTVSDTLVNFAFMSLVESVETNGTLDIDETWTLTYTYTVTPADETEGKIVNSVSVSYPGNPNDPVVDEQTVYQPAYTVVKTAAEDRFYKLGDKINYTVTVTNTGQVAMPNLVVDDTLVDFADMTLEGDSGTIGDLDVGETWTYKYFHIVTEADLAARHVLNRVTVTDPRDERHPIADEVDTPLSSFTVEKTAGQTSFYQAGEELTYTVLVTNTGNVVVEGLTISDSLVPFANMALVESVTTNGNLDLGETWTLTYDYTVTGDDVTAGKVLNTITVTDPSNPDNPVEDELTVSKASFTVLKTAAQNRFYAVDDVINYTVTVTNTGTANLSTLTVTDSLVTLNDAMRTESISSDGILEVGETWTYEYAYTVTEDDVTAGKVLNMVTVTDTNNPDNPVKDRVTIYKPSYTVEKTAAEDRFYKAGDILHYTVKVKNTGLVTLAGLTISDTLVPFANMTLAESVNTNGKLDIGETWTLTYTYTVKQTDVATGEVLNTVTVTDPGGGGNPGNGGIQDQVNTPLSRFTLEKSVTQDRFHKAGDVLNYTAIVVNTGQIDIEGLTGEDSLQNISPLVLVESGIANRILEVGETWTVTYSYVVTEDDVAAGIVFNEAIGWDIKNPDNRVSDQANTPLYSFTVEKTAAEDRFHKVGDDLNYTVTITNTGQIAIENLVVDDTLVDFADMTLEGDSGTIGDLDVGETWTLTYTYTVTAADVATGKVRNTVTVTDPGDPDNPVEGELTVHKPSYTVVKEAAQDRFHEAGEVLNYTVTVENTGQVAIEDLYITDTLVPTAEMTLAESGTADEILEVGETWTLTYTYTVKQTDVAAGKVRNTVTVTDPANPDNPVRDQVDTPLCSFTVEKTAAEDKFFAVNDKINYEITITNTGNIAIANPTVTDTLLPFASMTLAESVTTNGTLDLNETWTLTYEYTVTDTDVAVGSVTNKVTVIGTNHNHTVEDELTICKPVYTVAKSVTEGKFNKVGDVLNYTATITNTGPVAVTKAELNISDTLVPSTRMRLSESLIRNDVLDLDETWTLTYSYTVTEADVEAGFVSNTFTARGVEDDVTVYKPSYTVVKTAAEDRFHEAGDTLHYTIIVTNTGNVAVEDLTISDTLVPFADMTLVESANTDGDLEVGETWTLTYTYTVTAADVAAGSVSNSVSVSDPDDPDNPVEDEVETLLYSYTVEKTVAEDRFHEAGDVLNYTVTVTNTGKMVVDGLTISDTLVPFADMTLVESVNTDGNLEVGETWTLTYSYTVTDADVAAGSVTNSVAASDPDDPDNPVEDKLTVYKPSYTVVKTAAENKFNKAGDVLNYTVIVTNTGKLVVEGLTISDTLVPFTDMTLVESVAANGNLDLDETWTLTYTYTVTDADVAAGSVANSVAVSDPDDPDNPTEDEVETLLSSYTVEKTASEDKFYSAGDVLNYTITVTNTGKLVVEGLTIADTLVPFADMTLVESVETNGNLDLGETWTLTYSYTVTEADVAAGKVLNSVTATDPGNPNNPIEDEATVYKPSYTVEKVAAEENFKTVGDLIHYIVKVTNTGKVALENLSITDSLITLTDEMRTESMNPDGILEVGETWTYTYVHTVTRADIDAGKVLNKVLAIDLNHPDKPAEDEVETPKADDPAVVTPEISKPLSDSASGITTINVGDCYE